MAVLVGTASLWGWGETKAVAECEAAKKQFRAAPLASSSSREDSQRSIEMLFAALRNRWDDAESHQLLSEGLIHRFRREAQARLRDLRPELPQSALREFSDPIALHRRACDFVRNRDEQGLEELRTDPLVLEYLKPALEHLGDSRRACPLLPRVHLRLCALRFLVKDPTRDSVADKILLLAPGNPDHLFSAGLLEFDAGHTGPACSCWRRYLELSSKLVLSSKHEQDILSLASQRLTMQEMIRRLLPDSPRYLIELAGRRYLGARFLPERTLLIERARFLLERSLLPACESNYLLARVFVLSDRFPEAIECYENAMKLKPGATRWRYELAVLFQAQGRFEEAREHAMLCAHLEPTRISGTSLGDRSCPRPTRAAIRIDANEESFRSVAPSIIRGKGPERLGKSCLFEE